MSFRIFLILLVLTLAGCVQNVYLDKTGTTLATPHTTLQCVHGQVVALGYHITDSDGALGFLRAQKAAQGVRGVEEIYLTINIWGTDHATLAIQGRGTLEDGAGVREAAVQQEGTRKPKLVIDPLLEKTVLASDVENIMRACNGEED